MKLCSEVSWASLLSILFLPFSFIYPPPIMQNHHSHLQNRKGLHTKVRRPSCLVFYYGPYYTQEIHGLQVFFLHACGREG